MKGRVDADVALEAARQAWGARELLLRLGVPQEAVRITSAVSVGKDQTLPLEQRPLLAAVQLVDGIRRPFTIECGPCVSKTVFLEACRVYFGRIAEGELTEEQLAREFHLTSAWIGREEIVEALRKNGHPVVLSALEPSEAN